MQFSLMRTEETVRCYLSSLSSRLLDDNLGWVIALVSEFTKAAAASIEDCGEPSARMRNRLFAAGH
jgi:hypothetical protein